MSSLYHLWWDLNFFFSDPDFSFLVIRHIRHQLKHGSRAGATFLTLFKSFLTRAGDFGNIDGLQVYDILEKNIEWSEFDEVIQRFSGEFLESPLYYFRLLDLSLRFVTWFFSLVFGITLFVSRRNPDKLPKSFDSILRWFTGLEAEENDLSRLISSFQRLYQFSRKVRTLPSFRTSSYMHELVAPLRRRLESPLDMALAEICNTYLSVWYKVEDKKSDFLSPSWANLGKGQELFLTAYSVLAAAVGR